LPVEDEERAGEPEADLPDATSTTALQFGNTSAMPLSSRLRFQLGWLFADVYAWTIRQIRCEQAQRGGFLWVPVLLGSGSVAYFHLPREPWMLAFPLAAIALLLAAWGKRGSILAPILVGCAIVAIGVSLAQWRSVALGTIMLEGSLIAELTGQINRVEQRADGRVRYTLNVMTLSEGRNVPQKVRLTARRSDSVFQIGQVVQGRARLGPPPGPAMPGGYDFRFFAWYAGIGGSGFFLGHPERVDIGTQPPMNIMMRVDTLRHQIGEILREALPSQNSALATALIIGDRSGIDEATNEDLRRAGLAHILAISGLHMALVSLTVIGFIRFIGAFQIELVARHPIKKWAGGVGLICATGYLVLSGASLSTQRAYVMVAIMLLAVLLDRRALTMRNVAIAALIVLVFTPEAALHPGFQMSFAAVAALVSTYEGLSNRASKRLSSGSVTSWNLYFMQARNYLFGLALVPLIAGLATGLFAAFHFYRIAPFGLLANMLAMPVVSFAVMPFALVSVILMPFGLEQLALQPMGMALQMVVAIAGWVADLSPSGSTGYIPGSALLFGTLGLMAATLCRSNLKLLSLPCLALMSLGLVGRPVPDLLIAETGRQVGLIVEDTGARKLVLSKPKAEKFTIRLWQEAYRAPSAQAAINEIQQHRRCDRFGCVLQKPGLVIAHIHNTARLSRDCLLADILVVPYEVPWACRFLPKDDRPLIIDAIALRARGAHAITGLNSSLGEAEPHQFKVITARQSHRRLWQNKLQKNE
jgi:competence protein ComEC